MPYLEANEKTLFFHSTEPVDGEKYRDLAVLAIHGLGSSHAFYLSLFSHLTDAGLRCTVYDTYGTSLHSIHV